MIPLEEFSETYHGQPLCYVGLGAKKSYNSLYLMGAYESSNGKYRTPLSQKLLVEGFKKAGKRLHMGKCCLHFKELDDVSVGNPRSIWCPNVATPRTSAQWPRSSA